MDTAGRSCHQKGCGQSKGKAAPGSAKTFQCGASRRPERSPRHGARRRKRLQRESTRQVQETIRTASPNPPGAASRRRRIGSRPGVGAAQRSSFCTCRHPRGSVDRSAQENRPLHATFAQDRSWGTSAPRWLPTLHICQLTEFGGLGRAMRGGGEVRALRRQHTRGAGPWRRPTAPARHAEPRRCRRAPRAARSPFSSPQWS